MIKPTKLRDLNRPQNPIESHVSKDFKVKMRNRNDGLLDLKTTDEEIAARDAQLSKTDEERNSENPFEITFDDIGNDAFEVLYQLYPEKFSNDGNGITVKNEDDLIEMVLSLAKNLNSFTPEDMIDSPLMFPMLRDNEFVLKPQRKMCQMVYVDFSKNPDSFDGSDHTKLRDKLKPLMKQRDEEVKELMASDDWANTHSRYLNKPRNTGRSGIIRMNKRGA